MGLRELRHCALLLLKSCQAINAEEHDRRRWIGAVAGFSLRCQHRHHAVQEGRREACKGKACHHVLLSAHVLAETQAT